MGERMKKKAKKATKKISKTELKKIKGGIHKDAAIARPIKKD
jgi:bacteriocin-like protein